MDDQDESVGEEMHNKVVEMVSESGCEVGFGEPPCVLWRADHKDCVGCLYRLGCGKMVRLLATITFPMTYEPKNFTDHTDMVNHTREMVNKILGAKTLEELEALPLV